uniref:Uncharacterized protein n=1 Tax=Acrobeloides nanus TaxID=290746 RepID=A0A914BWX3_9BILA
MLICHRPVFTLIHVAILLISLTTSADIYAEEEVRCFCDKLTCPGSIVCTGKWCLIGVRGEGGQGRLDQFCGYDDAERPEDCAQSWNKWTEVCACTENLCNTFAYLRANIDRNNEEIAQEDPHRRTRVPKVADFKSNRAWYQNHNQIVLLLIIPLAVGGFVVCLIFLNFHCKMS